MKIIAWNCKEAFQNKYRRVLDLKPDILVISECGRPRDWSQLSLVDEPTLPLGQQQCTWFGEAKKQKNEQRKIQYKGLAVFALGDYRLTPLVEDLSNVPIWCVPVRIIPPAGEPFGLLAVWSKYQGDPRNKKRNPKGNPIVHALEDFEHLLASPDFVVAGDFNKSESFDNHNASHGFTTINAALNRRDLVSAYHTYKSEAYGFEREPYGQEKEWTHYFRYVREDKFHIDYVYLPKAWTHSGLHVEVGKFDDWIGGGTGSDHVPVIVDINAS